MTDSRQPSPLPNDPQINRDILDQFDDEDVEAIEIANSDASRAFIDEETRLDKLRQQLESEFGSELKQGFDEYLDTDGPYTIAGQAFYPSQILFNLDSDTYEKALADFGKQEVDEAIESVVQYYPTPIAFHFYRAANEDNDVRDRFSALKDTWEAVIYLLFAVVLGEFRAQKHPLKISKKPLRKYLCDWKLSAKLKILRNLYNFAQQENLDLLCMKIVSLNLLNRIHDLNLVRNEYAHSAAWSKSQTQQYLAQYLEEVVTLLRMASEFEDITLLRYEEGTEVHTKPRFSIFAGRYLDHDVKIHDISQWQIHNPLTLNDKNILVLHSGHIYTISPWYHFVPADDGHGIRLCYFKQQDNSSKDMTYEIIGPARSIIFPEVDFQNDMIEIDRLLQA